MVEFIGLGLTNDFSETHPRTTAYFDHDFTKAMIEAHESNGWDGVIVQYTAAGVDPSMAAAYASTVSSRIKLIIAVRPNTCFPTFLAKQLATLDTITGGGRIRLHVIAGGYAAGQAAEGDSLEKDKRYDRAGEFIDLCRKAWTVDFPFSYSGEYYSVSGFYAKIRCVSEEGLFVSTAGTSEAALRMAARYSHRHAVYGLPLNETKLVVDMLRRYCDEIGRDELPEMQMQFRPILGSTNADARVRAGELLNTLRSNLGGRAKNREPQTGSAKLALDVLSRGEWHDDCFWAGPAGETSGAGSSTALVGTGEQLAEALCKYHEYGITAFGLNGYDTLEDVVSFGREVIPIVRAELKI
ncbi:LLM class flavin-dependent oxidoreductase [Nocardia sp. 2YAB30]|uniref:LLM class flavin-dependent oxidoreductase n=1 Tax=unclassified Nocardia TaxID=2637762 RepID=UPI003F99DD51